MKLTTFTNHALRALQMAALHNPALVRVDDVRRVDGISRLHVTKIEYAQGKAGFLQTVRCRGGGFWPGRPAGAIVADEVVRLTGGRWIWWKASIRPQTPAR